jgi:hypothetical protein
MIQASTDKSIWLGFGEAATESVRLAPAGGKVVSGVEEGIVQVSHEQVSTTIRRVGEISTLLPEPAGFLRPLLQFDVKDLRAGIARFREVLDPLLPIIDGNLLQTDWLLGAVAASTSLGLFGWHFRSKAGRMTANSLITTRATAYEGPEAERKGRQRPNRILEVTKAGMEN